MCGVVGVFSKEKIKLSLIKSMCDCIIHRGPDDEGFLISESCLHDTVLEKVQILKSKYHLAFGHRRLAIQDLSDCGHQPMLYNNRYWIVYNGEIFNFLELKEELESYGYRFNSHSDTEVIMAAYDKWGTECLNKFNGMWAFVIYDVYNEKVFIARDRFGIKPLYYYQDENNFVFASEIKALLRNNKVTKKPNLEYCKAYLKEGPKEFLKETAFENIFRFNKASFIEVVVDDLFAPIEEEVYWEVKPNLSLEPFSETKAEQYAEQYYNLIQSSVELRLRADVKVASALSGGLDSSSIVCLIDKNLKENKSKNRQETFSSVYTSKETLGCDESFFIDKVTSALSLKSNKIEPNVDEVIEYHRKYIYHLDTPASNTLMSNWYTYKLTSDSGFKVSLDGQGADEQLAGYGRYLTHRAFESSFLNIVKLYFEYRSTCGALSYIYRGLLLKVASLLSERLFCKIFKNKNAEYLRRAFKQTNDVMYLDFDLNLEAFFNYADKGAMAFSIESRMPFMDYRLVEYLASVPISYKMHDSWSKYLARKSFDGKLPDDIVWRKDKMGWPAPEEYWFKGKLRGYFVSQIRASKILSKLDLCINYNDNMMFDHYNFHYLMRCYVLTLWHDIFFDELEEN